MAPIIVTGFCNTGPAGIMGRLYNDANNPPAVAGVPAGPHSWTVTFPVNYVTVPGEYVLEVFYDSATGVSDSVMVTIT